MTPEEFRAAIRAFIDVPEDWTDEELLADLNVRKCQQMEERLPPKYWTEERLRAEQRYEEARDHAEQSLAIERETVRVLHEILNELRSGK